MNTATVEYPRMRDTYQGRLDKTTLVWEALYSHYYVTIASNLNMTLKTSASGSDENFTVLFYSGASSRLSNELSLARISLKHSTSLQLRPNRRKSGLKFLYCANRKKFVDSVFLYPLIAKAVPSPVQIAVLVCYLAVWLITKTKKQTSAITLLAPLFATDGVLKNIQRFNMYQLWTFGGFFLSQYLDASLTSLTTSPTPDRKIDTLEEMWSEGYRVPHLNAPNLELIRHSILAQVKLNNETLSDNKNKRYVNKREFATLKVLQRFLEILPVMTGENDEKQLVKRLVHGWREVMISNAATIDSYLHYTSDFLAKEVVTNKSMETRVCYLSDQLICDVDSYEIFAGPGRKKAGILFDRLFESGINAYWVDELMKHISSVLMRNRIRRAARVLWQERLLITSPISLRDKATNIMVGWFNLLAIALLIFSWEICCSRARENNAWQDLRRAIKSHTTTTKEIQLTVAKD